MKGLKEKLKKSKYCAVNKRTNNKHYIIYDNNSNAINSN